MGRLPGNFRNELHRACRVADDGNRFAFQRYFMLPVCGVEARAGEGFDAGQGGYKWLVQLADSADEKLRLQGFAIGESDLPQPFRRIVAR